MGDRPGVEGGSPWITSRDLGEWAQANFGSADLRDPRRTRRLTTAAALIAAHPEKSFPQVFDWGGPRGFYRLCDSPLAATDSIQAPHRELTRAAMTRLGVAMAASLEAGHGLLFRVCQDRKVFATARQDQEGYLMQHARGLPAAGHDVVEIPGRRSSSRWRGWGTSWGARATASRGCGRCGAATSGCKTWSPASGFTANTPDKTPVSRFFLGNRQP